MLGLPVQGHAKVEHAVAPCAHWLGLGGRPHGTKSFCYAMRKARPGGVLPQPVTPFPPVPVLDKEAGVVEVALEEVNVADDAESVKEEHSRLSQGLLWSAEFRLVPARWLAKLHPSFNKGKRDLIRMSKRSRFSAAAVWGE